MSWPISQDYNEAIQSPETSFSDPELKKGEVVCNALGIPLPRSGNFADVYEFRCTNGSRWAIKCFTRQVAGLRERYQEISRALQEAKLPFTVEFTYQQEGILIRGQWYPILKMQWVEGFTFNEFVRQNLDKPAMMDGLLQIWGRMAQRLRTAGIAHADLQHGNVLLVPGSTANSLAVKLIDYDGMFVPTLAGKPSGEVGHPSYQHPQRVREGIYSPEVDRFPLLLIATSLRCVRAGGRALWERHDNGDNLLFREADLKAPDKSKLFEELNGLSDSKAGTLVGLVRQALAGGYDRVPLLEEVLSDLSAVTTQPAAKPVRLAPVAAPAEAIAVSAGPSRAARAAIAAIKAEAPVVVAMAADFDAIDEPGPRRKRRGRKKKQSSKALWIGGAIAAGVLVVGGMVTGLLLLLSGKPKPAAPAADQQAAVQPHDKDGGAPQTKPPVKDPNKQPVKDPPKNPINDPKVDPVKDPMSDPVVPVNVEDGVFRLRHTLTGTGLAKSIAVSADGKLGLSCNNNDGTINVWDLDTGTLTELKTPYSAVSGLAFLPGNKTILFSADDAKLHRWNLTKQAPNQAGKQWTQLFNGKDLTGWNTHPDDKTQWSVKDGILIGEPPGGLLFSERGDYTDFHFRVEARINEGGDSGLFFRVMFGPCKGGVPPGYEAQINGKTRPPFMGTGSLLMYWKERMTPEEMQKLIKREEMIKPNEWFTYEVIAIGNHIVIKVNGQTTIDFVDPANRHRKGHLAIQQSGPNDLIHIRKAEVMELLDNAGMESEGFGGGSPEGHPTKVDCLEVSADGKIAVTGCQDKIRTWNLDTDKRLPDEWPHVGLHTVSLSIAANARVVVSHHTDVHILVWDLDSGSKLMMFGDPSRGGHECASALTPDGKMVVTGSDIGEIVLHDIEKRVYNARKLASLGMSVKALAVSADGRYLAAAGSSQTTKVLAIFNMASGKELQRFDNTAVIPGELKFAAASNCLLAAGSDGKLRVFDFGKAQDSALPISWQGHTNRVTSVAFSPDGRRIVSGGYDTMAKIWDAQTGKMVLLLKGHVGSVYGVAWSANGKWIASASLDKTVKVWDADSGAVLFTLKGHTGRVASVAFSADSQHIISGGGGAGPNENGEVIVWDAARGDELLRLQGHSGGVMCVAISPDGKRIASGSWDTTLKVWDANTRKEILTMKGHGTPVGSIAFSPNGQRIVSGGGDANLRIWDADNGNELNTLKGHTGPIYSLAISSDGKRIISASTNSSLKEWDADSGKIIRELKGYTTVIYAVAYSADGNCIVSGTGDGMLKFYPDAKGLNQDAVRNQDPVRNPDQQKDAGQQKDGGVSTTLDAPASSRTGTWKVLGNLTPNGWTKEMAPKGSVLIGLEVGIRNAGGGREVVRAIRAIYRNADGEEVKGIQYGTNLTGVVTVKAKPGYAVAGIIAKAGAVIEGVRVIFMRLGPDGKLDPSDSYESGRAGGLSVRPEARLGGDGTLVIGVYCKTTDKDVNGFSLVPKQP